VADSHDNLHLIWNDWVDQVPHWPYTLYAFKAANGGWSAFQYMPNFEQGAEPTMVIDQSDTLHIVYGTFDDHVNYVQRRADGTWLSELVPGAEDAASADVGAAADGSVHVIWWHKLGGPNPTPGELFHNFRSPDGSWHTPALITVRDESALPGIMAVDHFGTVHVLWSAENNTDWYARREPGAPWVFPQQFAVDLTITSNEQLIADRLGRVHFVWIEYGDDGRAAGVKYMVRVGGGWAPPQRLLNAGVTNVAVGLNGAQRPEVVWNKDGEIWHTFQIDNGGWYPASLVTTTNRDSAVSVTGDSRGGHHVVWDTSVDGDIWYSTIAGDPAIQFTVPPAGETYETPSGDFRIAFPPGSVAEDTIVTYEPRAAGAAGPLAGVRFFDLTAATASGQPVSAFNPPFTLTVTYETTGPAVEESVGIYWYDGNHWVREASSVVDVAHKRVSATVNHMTAFAVLGTTHSTWLPITVR
jgi:hypothetical protein